MSALRSLSLALSLALLLPACGGSSAQEGEGNSTGGNGESLSSLPYARSVESFSPGEGAGFGQSLLPDVVLGPPHGKGERAGSLDVLSLGAAGEIVLGFGELGIVDGSGPDFVVFENAFWPGGDPTQVFAELGEVSVSEDGETWHAFECDSVGDGLGRFPGCAGFTPTLAYEPSTMKQLAPEQTGGDAFDLADLELTSARFVRIRDLQTLEAEGTSAGFDLDAVGIINAQTP